MLTIVGDLAQDVVVWLYEPLRIGSDTSGDIHIVRGGSAANVACAAAELTPTRFIGCVGDDDLGRALEAAMRRCGADVRLQHRGETGVIVVLIDRSGERTMIPRRGANALLDRVDPTWLDGTTMLHLTSYSFAADPARSEVVRLARSTHERGGKVSVDASSSALIEALGLDQYLSIFAELRPDVLLANEQEWDALGADDLEIHRPPGLESTTFVRKAGPAPVRIHPAGAPPLTVPAPVVADVIDTTGAGDAFAAGFLSQLLDRADWRRCAEAGHACASAVLGQPGAGRAGPSI